MGYESSDVVRFDLGPLLQGQMRVAKLKSAFNLLIVENAVYLLNYVSWPFPVDTSCIWPQMRPWSSYFSFTHCDLIDCGSHNLNWPSV